eukprot:TRINITY_DN3153_c0_g1_i3.p1 TRINITY_DN3153_c0_g1~~TRINITY_DN3153_c0_g1_i3.p1  ORF type:complete len:938 (+),score=166.22 TRINITY_DN3153_c0_g1_i3:117-2930(+)
MREIWESESEGEEGQKQHWLLIKSSTSCSVCFYNVSTGFQSIDERIRDDLNRFFSTGIDIGSSICNNCYNEYLRFRKESVVYPFIFKNFGEDFNKRRRITSSNGPPLISSPPSLLISPNYPITNPSSHQKKEKKSKKEKKEKKTSNVSVKKLEEAKTNTKRKGSPSDSNIQNSIDLLVASRPSVSSPNTQSNSGVQMTTGTPYTSNNPQHSSLYHHHPTSLIDKKSKKVRTSSDANHFLAASATDETSTLISDSSSTSHHTLPPCCMAHGGGHSSLHNSTVPTPHSANNIKGKEFNPTLVHNGMDFNYIGAYKVPELQEYLKKYNASGKGSKANLQQRLIKILYQNYTQPPIHSYQKSQGPNYANGQGTTPYMHNTATNYYATTTTNENGEIQQVLVPMNYSLTSEGNLLPNTSTSTMGRNNNNTPVDPVKSGGITIAHGANGAITQTTIARGRNVTGPSPQKSTNALKINSNNSFLDVGKSKSKYVIKNASLNQVPPGVNNGSIVKASADTPKHPRSSTPFFLIQPNSVVSESISAKGNSNVPTQHTLYATPSSVDPKTGVQYYHLYQAPSSVNNVGLNSKKTTIKSSTSTSISPSTPDTINAPTSPPPKTTSIANPYSNPGGNAHSNHSQSPIQRMQVIGNDGKSQYLQIIPVVSAQRTVAKGGTVTTGPKINASSIKGPVTSQPALNANARHNPNLISNGNLSGPVRVVKGLSNQNPMAQRHSLSSGGRVLGTTLNAQAPNGINGPGVSSVPITSAPAGAAVPLITSSLQITQTPNANLVNAHGSLSPNSTIIHSASPPLPRALLNTNGVLGGHTISHNQTGKNHKVGSVAGNKVIPSGGNTIAHTHNGRVLVSQATNTNLEGGMTISHRMINDNGPTLPTSNNLKSGIFSHLDTFTNKTQIEEQVLENVQEPKSHFILSIPKESLPINPSDIN